MTMPHRDLNEAIRTARLRTHADMERARNATRDPRDPAYVEAEQPECACCHGVIGVDCYCDEPLFT